MNFFKLLLLLVLLGGGLIFLLLYILITFLRKRDLKIDYSNKQIRFFIQNINGIDYLIIPYLFWQNGKLNAIRDLFSDHFEYNGICYKSNYYILIRVICNKLATYFHITSTGIVNL